MISPNKIALGKLPGEVKKRPKATGELGPESGVHITISAEDLKKLTGKGSYPVYIDLSTPNYNITNVYFLEDAKNVIQL